LNINNLTSNKTHNKVATAGKNQQHLERKRHPAARALSMKVAKSIFKR
jgi:hypothetical protein